jgi:hypothetical protein
MIKPSFCPVLATELELRERLHESCGMVAGVTITVAEMMLHKLHNMKLGENLHKYEIYGIL